MKKENYYYLFGEEVVDAFNYGNIDDVIALIKEGMDYSTFRYKVDYNIPTDLLIAYDGNTSWTEIDKLTYDQLQKAISEL